jgi:hypothetical protein
MSQVNHTRSHKLSALDEIDSLLQPVGRAPGLRAEVDRLAELKDVGSLCSLYEAYVAAAMAFQALENQPRSSGTREFLAEESEAALFNCMIAMGHSLDEAVAVVNEINAWPERPARQ